MQASIVAFLSIGLVAMPTGISSGFVKAIVAGNQDTSDSTPATNNTTPSTDTTHGNTVTTALHCPHYGKSCEITLDTPEDK